MAMRTTSPWWFSAIFAGALCSLFLGERAFDEGTLHWALSGMGWLGVVGVTGLRAMSMLSADGERRKVERSLLLCQLGVLLGLLGYLLTTDFGQGLLGLDDMTTKGKARFETAVSVLYGIVLLGSLAPLLMAELSLGTSNRDKWFIGSAGESDKDMDDAHVDAYRVAQMATAGLTVALAISLSFVTCSVATNRNIRKDVSYFKTSSPGSATVNIVKSVPEPITVLLFFPSSNEVLTEVRGYFDSLADKAGNVTVEVHDHMVSASLAEKYKVKDNGTIVLIKDKKSEKITVNKDIKRARRRELRTLDSKVQAAVMKVVRAKRMVYMTVGHGELNDPSAIGPLGFKDPRMKAGLIKKILGVLNYQVKDLSVAGEIPDDATMVIMLAPRTDLLPQELAAIDRYLARGGSLLLAMDPRSMMHLGLLKGRLGVEFHRQQLADDRSFLRQRGNVADRVFLVTNQFSSHASVTTLSRLRSKLRMPFVQAGHFTDAPFTSGDDGKPDAADKKKRKRNKKGPKRTWIIRSMPTTFVDVNKNFTFDKGSEKRGRYNLAGAIEDPTAKPATADKKAHGMRAIVVADVDVFTDIVQGQVRLSQAFFADSVKWLGGEEQFAGVTSDERDIPLKHTRGKDVVWFYGSIVGAPFLVLALGLLSGFRRRKGRA